MYTQGGIHKESLLPVKLVMNGFAEAEMFSGVRQREVVSLKKAKLIDGKSKDPGDVSWFNGKEVVVFSDEGHVVVVK